MEPTIVTSRPLTELVERVVDSYVADPVISHLDSTFLPSRSKTVELIELLRRVMFPGFFDDHRLTSQTIHDHTDQLLHQVRHLLYEQVREALQYQNDRVEDEAQRHDGSWCDQQAAATTMAILERVPLLRRALGLDVRAAFEGDPAAHNVDETIFCYPGIDAIMVHRIAHELWKMKIPLIPRIMSEYVHNETGIDIHPGATIGQSFFLDHGTGVVIGETTIIGDRVKIYQGVTLGALSTKGGQAWRGRKRHPTIEDDVTIYGGAIILGGSTVIGRGTTIGGSVFLTGSVPPYHTVTMKPPQLKVSSQKRGRAKDSVPAAPRVDPPHEPFDPKI